MSIVKPVESQFLEEFEGWVREHQAGLRAFIRALGVDEAWVDDLAQEAVCRACSLHEGHDHSPAIRVVCGKSTRIYYLERNPAVAGLSVCGGPIPVIAKGHARTEEGRLWFQATALTIQKPEKLKDPPTNSQSPLPPM